MKTLKDVKVGETATVARLHGEGPVKRRIMDMGITKGVEIYVRKVIGRLYLLTDSSVKRNSLPGKKKDDKCKLIHTFDSQLLSKDT